MNGSAKGISGVPPLTSTIPKNNVQTVKTVQQPPIKSEPGHPTTSSQSTSAPQAQNGPPALQTTLDPNKLIPIQITLPPQANETENRVLTIKVPARAIQENQLQQVITGEIIASIMPLQPSVASAVLQQHVTSVLNTLYAKSKEFCLRGVEPKFIGNFHCRSYQSQQTIGWNRRWHVRRRWQWHKRRPVSVEDQSIRTHLWLNVSFTASMISTTMTWTKMRTGATSMTSKVVLKKNLWTRRTM